MAAGRIVIPGWMPALDSNGSPIPNAQIYLYLNGTTTLATVYSDDTLTTPIANPVEANSSGQFPEIWADDANLFSVSVDAPFGPPGIPFTFDSIGPATASAVIEVATEAGAAAAGVVVATKLDKINAATPLGLAVPTLRSEADRLATETAVAGKDFSVTADGSTNDALAIQRLIDYARINGRAIDIVLPPVGTIGCGQAIIINGDNIRLIGPGKGALHNSGSPPPGVALIPVGGYSGPLMRHESVIDPTGYKVHGGGFVGLTTRGNPLRALDVTSVLGGEYDLYCEGVTGEAAVIFKTLKDQRATLPNRQLGEAGDNQQFSLKLRGRITGENGANASAHGVIFRGCGTTEGGNTSAARRIDIDMRTVNGHMVLVEAADTLAMELRHEGLGTGRCLYVKGATANTVVDDIYAYIAANTQAVFEGTETLGVIGAPGGLVTTDRNNSTPRPIIGTGCNVVVIDPDLQIGMRMVAALSAGDIFGLNLLRAAVASNVGFASGDSGAGAHVMRMASGGRVVWGESSATRGRALLQNGLVGLDLNGDFVATKMSTTAGGITQKPTPGWKTSHAPLELFCEVVPGTTEADPVTMRFFYKTPSGIVKAAFISMPTL